MKKNMMIIKINYYYKKERNELFRTKSKMK